MARQVSITVNHRSKPYTWTMDTLRSAEGRAEIARVLREAKMDAGYAGKKADKDVADRVLGLIGDGRVITDAALRELGEIGTSVSETITPQEGDGMAANTNNTDIERIKEMNRISSDREGAEALRRAATGQDLDARQAAIVQRYKALELAHNEQARHEQHSPGGWMKTTRPHALAPELYALEKIKDPRERVHAIRSLKSQWRDDPKSAYNDTAHGDHKNAVEWMQRLYREEEALGPTVEDAE